MIAMVVFMLLFALGLIGVAFIIVVLIDWCTDGMLDRAIRRHFGGKRHGK